MKCATDVRNIGFYLSAPCFYFLVLNVVKNELH